MTNSDNPDRPSIDTAAAHRHFSTECFNRTWAFLDLPERSPHEQEQMILLALASLWHWTQRIDCTDQNRSIGHWLAARVYAVLGQGANAREHALRSLHFAAQTPPFYLAYAHEALARAAKSVGDAGQFREHLDQARLLTKQVEDTYERHALESDLNSLDT